MACPHFNWIWTYSICVCARVYMYKCVSMCVCVFGYQSQKKNKSKKKLFLFRHSSVPFVTFMLFGIIIKAHARTFTIVSLNVANKRAHNTDAHSQRTMSTNPHPYSNLQTYTHTHTHEQKRMKKGKQNENLCYFITITFPIRFETWRNLRSNKTHTHTQFFDQKFE